jgi:hypothetical protein
LAAADVSGRLNKSIAHGDARSIPAGQFPLSREAARKMRGGTTDMTRHAAPCKAHFHPDFGRARVAFRGGRLWPPGNGRQINVLLCILKGFALAQPLCSAIK